MVSFINNSLIPIPVEGCSQHLILSSPDPRLVAKYLGLTQSLSGEVPPHTRKISESFPSKGKSWARSSSESTRNLENNESLLPKETLWNLNHEARLIKKRESLDNCRSAYYFDE
ncbi:hypothetical protein KSP39_PZI005805 [Platanthera zijinensis]|uniref:Uncharacterized protein n=1 Tax=Platanthera zijinensis TaxID=2320716 RepID=A0AAP0BSE5_9ASPA